MRADLPEDAPAPPTPALPPVSAPVVPGSPVQPQEQAHRLVIDLVTNPLPVVVDWLFQLGLPAVAVVLLLGLAWLASLFNEPLVNLVRARLVAAFNATVARFGGMGQRQHAGHGARPSHRNKKKKTR